LDGPVGLGPGPLTNAVIDEAVAQGIAATDDLYWKSALPPTNRLKETDLPKDIAAMAHNGAGPSWTGLKSASPRLWSARSPIRAMVA
jgi:hypothetical protein